LVVAVEAEVWALYGFPSKPCGSDKLKHPVSPEQMTQGDGEAMRSHCGDRQYNSSDAHLGHIPLEEVTRSTDTGSCRTLERVPQSVPPLGGWRGGTFTEEQKTNINKDHGSWGQAEPYAFLAAVADLGRASPDLPLNAGWERHQAACRTWPDSMRKENNTLGKQEHSKLFPPHSLFY
jgi:hypothetical protein